MPEQSAVPTLSTTLIFHFHHPPPPLIAPLASIKSATTTLTTLQHSHAIRPGCYNARYDSAARTRTSSQIPPPALRLTCPSTDIYGFDRQDHSSFLQTFGENQWYLAMSLWRSKIPKRDSILKLSSTSGTKAHRRAIFNSPKLCSEDPDYSIVSTIQTESKECIRMDICRRGVPTIFLRIGEVWVSWPYQVSERLW